MLAGKKAQMFTYLLVIMTVIVLGTAFYFIASKSAEFEGSLGRQPYAATKAFYSNNKLLILYQSLAQEKMDEILGNLPFLIGEQTSCGKAGDVYFWIKDDQKCIPNIMEKIERDFNEQFTEEFDKVNTAKLNKESLAKFEKLTPNLLGGREKEESLLLQVLFEDEIKYSITPNLGEFVLSANNPWKLAMRDAVEGKGTGKAALEVGGVSTPKIFSVETLGSLDVIAGVSQYPNFRIKTPINTKIVKTIQDIPLNLIETCRLTPSSELQQCADKRLSVYGPEGEYTFTSSVHQNRDVIINYILFGADKQVASTIPLFAVRIPDQGAYRITSFSADYKGDDLTAFYFDEDESIIVKGSASVPQTNNLILEICMRQKVEEGKLTRFWTCPGNLKVFENGQFTPNTQGTISADNTNVAFAFDWATNIPKLEKTFEFTLRLRSNVGTNYEGQITHNKLILVSR